MSEPRLRYGPNRPLWATTSSPVSGPCPTGRGMRSSSSACSNVSVAGSMAEKSDAVRGFSLAVGHLAHLDVGPEAARP